MACTNTPPLTALGVFLPVRSDFAPSRGGNREALGVTGFGSVSVSGSMLSERKEEEEEEECS